MAVALTGTGGLFTRLGKIGNIINVVNTHRGTTIITDVDELQDQYNEDRDLTQGVEGGLINHQSANGGYLDTLKSVAQDTLITMVNDDNPQPDTTLGTAMAELITQMTNSSDSVNANAIGISYTADANNTGTGVLVLTNKNGDGDTQEYVLPEDIKLTCTSDSQTGGATAGNEGFTAAGEAEETNKLSWLWTKGSGASASVTAFLTSGDDSGGNKLTNSDFETFTTTNDPDNWEIVVGAAGTDVLEEATTIYSGSKALEFVGDGSTLTQIRQIFNDSTNGTGGTLTPNTVYTFNLWGKVDVAPGAGVITVDLFDGTSVITDDAGTSNSFTIALTSIGTTYASKTGVFITPRVLPTNAYLRIRLSTALSTGSSFFFDHVTFGEATQLYDGGPFVGIHPSSTAFIEGDFFTITPTNDEGGAFQQLFERLFNMRTLGQQLPSNSGGGETISDGLIA